MLVLVGEGGLEQNVRRLVCDFGLEGRVIFYGTTKSPEEVYFASDVFILPSLHEGLPLTAVEAQAAGLRCFLSDAVTAEAKLSDNCEFFSLTDDVREVASRIVRCECVSDRINAADIVRNQGYSIEDEAKKLASYYGGLFDE